MERPVRGHERHEQLQGQVQEARLPWAQPARLAARVRAKCKQKGQSLSPADKRDHPCCPLRPPPAARVPQQEGPAPEAQLHWTQPDRGTASGRAKGGGAPEYEGSGSAKVSPLRRTAAEAALGWAQDLPRRAVSRAGSVPVLKLSRNWGRHSPLNDGAKGCRQSPLNDGLALRYSKKRGGGSPLNGRGRHSPLNDGEKERRRLPSKRQGSSLPT